MEKKNPLITYAQYREDLTLLSILHDIDEGFYIDVGANYATTDSVTKLFYDRSWCGINIEPIKKHHTELMRLRERDINLNIALGSKKEKKIFFEDSDKSGHSSFVQVNTDEATRISYEVQVDTLENVCKTYCSKRSISFLKIDVEGFEHEVIKGANFNRYRPIVICIETSHVAEDWRSLITENDYTLIISDGLNEYYLANEELDRLHGLEERLVMNDYLGLKNHQYQSILLLKKQYNKVLLSARHYEEIIADQESKLADYDQYKSFSLYKASFRTSLKLFLLKIFRRY